MLYLLVFEQQLKGGKILFVNKSQVFYRFLIVFEQSKKTEFKIPIVRSTDQFCHKLPIVFLIVS